VTATAEAPVLLDPRAVLRVAGVGGLEEAVLHDVSRSHSVTLAELPDGRAFVVKQVSPTARAAGRSLAAELYAYRLASWRPALAAALPTPVHLDERRQVLALVAAAPWQLYEAQAGDDAFPSTSLATALGRALAAVHTSTSGQPLLADVACGVLHLPDTDEQGWRLGDESAGAWEVAREAAGDAVLAPVLREAAASLRPSCLVHGDVKWDNTVLDPGRVLLFDWELSGSGDPAWDLGCALAETSTLPVRLGGADPAEAAGWLRPSAVALLAGYIEWRSVEADLARRAVLCWVGRTVHLALECAGAMGSGAMGAGSEVVVDLLASARRLAAVRDDVVGRVERVLRP